MYVKSFVVSFSVCLLLLFVARFSVATATIDPDAKKMMEDMGRNVSNRCFTPPNLSQIFSRACMKVLDGNISQCSFAWTAFKLAFGLKDPNTVTAEDYDTYFDVLPVKSPADSAVYWSGMSVKSVVELLSQHPNISSSVNQLASRIVNTMIKNDSVLCWCGNTAESLDTVNPCPVTPVVEFWKAFSRHFGESAKGIVYLIVDGNRKGGAFQNTSFFAKFEFPKLISSRIDRLVVININDCNSKTVEKCGEGTLKQLEDQAVSKYGRGVGYHCEVVCGNASDNHKVTLLANHTLQIINEEQSKVTTVSFSQSAYTVNEEDGYIRPVLVLSNASSVPVTVQIMNEDITASSRYSSDYYQGPYSVTFPAGVTTASFTIRISDDNTLELTNEIFAIVINVLLLPKNVTYGKFERATVTIVSNEVGVTFERCDYSVNETNSQVQIFLILTSPLSTDTTVRVTDSYTTAIGGIDYFPGPFDVEFPAGMTSILFHILIADDEIAEKQERFRLEIHSNSLYYLVKPYKFSSTYVFIKDNDFVTINFNQSAYIVNETSSYVYPILVLSKPYSDTFNVRITVDSLTASSGIYNDYYIYSYYIGIPAGMTTVSFSIQINDDSLIEGYESFNIYVHEDSLPNVYVGSHNRATVTIVDDDSTSISFDQPTYNVDENNKGIQTMLVLSKPQYTDIIVEVIDFGITATRNIDYNSGPYSVTFPTGTTNALFTIPIADDNITENTEAFLLNINPVSLSNNLIFGDHGGAVVTIVDNDFATINFEKPAYSIDEYDGAIHPVLILSNPLSDNITVKVLNTDGSADGLGLRDVDYSGTLGQSDEQIDIDSEEGDDDYGSGPYFIKLTAGMTHFPFNISIRDDNRVEHNENFFLTIDKSSLPCHVTVGNQDQTTVTIVEDDPIHCIVNTISGNVNHNREQGRTVLTFNTDNTNATYTCKLDQESYKDCTSPKTWNNLKNGQHTVTVKASCVIDGTTFSSTRLKIEFQVR